MVGIEKISANSSVQLMVKTNKKIEDKDIIIKKNGNKVDVKYSSEVVDPIKAQIKNILINAIVYGIVLFIANTIADRNRDKKIKAYEEKSENIIKTYEESKKDLIDTYKLHKEAVEEISAEKDRQIQDAKEEMKKILAEIDKYKVETKKQHILLFAKLNDYRKELNFWRNTIRKLLYQLPDGNEKAEQIFKAVSNSLKTYQTNEKNEHDFESLLVLSKIIKDIEDNK